MRNPTDNCSKYLHLVHNELPCLAINEKENALMMDKIKKSKEMVVGDVSQTQEIIIFDSARTGE